MQRLKGHRKEIGAWAALVLWSTFIWFVNTRPSLPHVQNDRLDYIVSQGGHFSTHLVLGILAWYAATRTWRHSVAYWLALVGLLMHAVLDEAVQMFVPPRDPNFLDIVYNVAGCMSGLALMELARLRGWIGVNEASRAAAGASQWATGLIWFEALEPSGGDGHGTSLGSFEDGADRREARPGTSQR